MLMIVAFKFPMLLIAVDMAATGQQSQICLYCLTVACDCLCDSLEQCSAREELNETMSDMLSEARATHRSSSTLLFESNRGTPPQ